MRITRILFVIAASRFVMAAGPLRRDKLIYYRNSTSSILASSDTGVEIIPLTSSVLTETSGTSVLTTDTIVPVLLFSSTTSSLSITESVHSSTQSTTNLLSEASGSGIVGTGNGVSTQTTSSQKSITTSFLNSLSRESPTVAKATLSSIMKNSVMNQSPTTSNSTSFSRAFTLQSTDLITIPSNVLTSVTSGIVTSSRATNTLVTASTSVASDTFTGTATIIIAISSFPSTSPSPAQTGTSTGNLEIPTVLTGVPTSTISASPSLLAQNLAQARSYNSLFLDINASSPCTPNQVACLPVPNAALSNTTGIGICNTEDKFDITPCPNSQNKEFGSVSTGCFAMPLQNAEGVTVECVDIFAAGKVLGPSATAPAETASTGVTSASASISLSTSISTQSVSTSTLVSASASTPPPLQGTTSAAVSVQSTSSETLSLTSSLTLPYTNLSAASSPTSTDPPGTTPISSNNQPGTSETVSPSSTGSSNTKSTATLPSGESVITIVPVTINSNQPVTVTETVTVTVHDH